MVDGCQLSIIDFLLTNKKNPSLKMTMTTTYYIQCTEYILWLERISEFLDMDAPKKWMECETKCMHYKDLVVLDIWYTTKYKYGKHQVLRNVRCFDPI